MHINGNQVAVDNLPIAAVRCFNAESFTFEAERPFTVGLIAMDFRENDTGLEYIWARRQQMGDGGMIVQFRDGSRSMDYVREGEANLIRYSPAEAPGCYDFAPPNGNK